MKAVSIQLTILSPSKVFLAVKDVQSIVVQTTAGSYGILPNRLDCVMWLVPGIFSYTPAEGKPVFLAVDEGVLIKVGPEVRISTRQAVDGADLGRLRDMVTSEFRRLNIEDQQLRTVVGQLESGFIRHLLQLQKT